MHAITLARLYKSITPSCDTVYIYVCVLVLLSFLYMWCMQYLYCCALINASASPNFPLFSFCYLIISCLSQLSIFACTKYLTSALKIGKGDVLKNIIFFKIFFSKPFIITLWNDCYIFSWLFLKNKMIRRMCVCCFLFTGRIISLLPERKWLLLSEGTSIFCKQSY